ncbi:hypothetical protein BH18ACI4_BH18ACI4_28320 [soil metagenome]
MRDTNDRKASNPSEAAGTITTATQNQVEDRLAEATSKETVTDLEKTSSKLGKSSDETSVPSPDGTPDTERSSGRADGSDTGGPM